MEWVNSSQEFTELAMAEGKIQDDLVDQHFISEFLMYSAKRPKMTTKRVPLPGTRVGSVSVTPSRSFKLLILFVCGSS